MKTLTTLCLLAAFAFFAGCKSELKDELPTSPEVAGVHPSGFMTPSSPDFHGTQLITSGFDVSTCQKCHGTNLDGGIAKRSCTGAGCHATVPGKHPDGFVNPGSAAFHGKLLGSQNFDMSDCQKCHGTDFAGGAAKKSCSGTGCHAAADGGPAACYTCHGDAASKKVYPIASAFHVTHLEGGDNTTLVVECAGCHAVPAAWNTPGHIVPANPLRAIVNITDTMAFVRTKGVAGTPSYDPATKKCANVYCHGNFTNGNNFSPQFDGAEQAKCGTCHGNPATGDPLPKAPHVQVATCSVCHAGVIDVNKVIIDKSKHMNGKLDKFGTPTSDW